MAFWIEEEPQPFERWEVFFIDRWRFEQDNQPVHTGNNFTTTTVFLLSKQKNELNFFETSSSWSRIGQLVLDSLEHGRVDGDGFVADDDLVAGVVAEEQLASALQLPLVAQVRPAVQPGPVERHARRVAGGQPGSGHDHAVPDDLEKLSRVSGQFDFRSRSTRKEGGG